MCNEHDYTDEPYTFEEIQRAKVHGPAVGGWIIQDRARRREEQRLETIKAARASRIALFVAIAALAVSVLQLIAGWLHH